MPHSVNSLNVICKLIVVISVISNSTFAIDTLRIGNKIFLIEPSSKNEFDKVPAFTFDTSEIKNLARDHQNVQRKGDTLYFNLLNGKKATLVNNNSDGDPRAIYFYVKEFPAISSYYVTGGGVEFHFDLFLNKATGDTTWFNDKPILSPDNKLIICAGYSESGEDLNGFELYEINNNNTISLIGELNETRLPNWIPQEARWVDNTTLLVERRFGHVGMESEKIDYIRISVK